MNISHHLEENNILQIHDDRFNRFIYAYDMPDVFKKALKSVYKRDYDDWVAQDGGTDIVNGASFCTFIYHPGRRYNDIVLYFNPRRILSNDLDYLHDLIVHETNHAAVHVLHDVGVDISYDNQETLAYQHEFIIRQVRPWLLGRYDI